MDRDRGQAGSLDDAAAGDAERTGQGGRPDGKRSPGRHEGFVEEAFKAAVGQWGLRPKDFWRLTPREVWWLAEAKRPPKMYGSLTESEVRDLYEATYGRPEA